MPIYQAYIHTDLYWAAPTLEADIPALALELAQGLIDDADDGAKVDQILIRDDKDCRVALWQSKEVKLWLSGSRYRWLRLASR